MDMLWDLCYERDSSQQSRVSTSTRRHFLSKGRVRIQRTHARYYLHQDYQVEGAWSHLARPGKTQCLESAQDRSTVILWSDDPLRPSVPYDYIAKRMPEPPHNDLTRGIVLCAIIFCIFMYPVIRGSIVLFWRLPGRMWFAAQYYYAGEPTDNPTDTPTHAALATNRVSWD